MPKIDDDIRTYDDMIAALKRRRIELGLTQEMLNHIAGFQDGYVNKLELGYRAGGRGVGNMSLPTWLDALGLRLQLVPVGLCVEEEGEGRADTGYRHTRKG